RHKQMHVVLAYVPFPDLYFVLPAHVPNQLSPSPCHLTGQHRLAILRRPHQMPMNLKHRVRAASVLLPPSAWYAARLLKLSPEGLVLTHILERVIAWTRDSKFLF